MSRISSVLWAMAYFFLPCLGFSYMCSTVIMDPVSGKVLYGSNYQASVYPASLTKMMSLFLLFEALEKKKINLSTLFGVSKKASAQPPSSLGLSPREKISVRQCILGLAVKSANDVAMVVAENLGGNSYNFVKMMNRKALELGLFRTNFCNPSGLPNYCQKTTAKDMALLLRALWKRFPYYSSFFQTKSFTRHKHAYNNTNKLLSKVNGLKMGKTGYINASGFNLATLTIRQNKPVIVVMIGGKTRQDRDLQVKTLIETFYIKREMLPLLLAFPSIASSPVLLKRTKNIRPFRKCVSKAKPFKRRPLVRKDSRKRIVRKRKAQTVLLPNFSHQVKVA